MKKVVVLLGLAMAVHTYGNNFISMANSNQSDMHSLSNRVISNDTNSYGVNNGDNKVTAKSANGDNPVDRLIIYPNPAQGTFKINASPGDKFAVITLFSSNGSQIWQQELESSEVPLVDFSLPEGTGFYLVEIKTSKRTIILTVTAKK